MKSATKVSADGSITLRDVSRAEGGRVAAASEQLTTIEIAKEALSFSIGHFTIFSATERERLHGHSYFVHCQATAAVGDNGMTFDYGLLKRKLKALCDEIDEYFVLPGRSPFLDIERDGTYVYGVFNGERIPFLESDALVLPIRNATVEEFSRWFVDRLVADDDFVAHDLRQLLIKVYSGPGQSGSCTWSAD